MDKIVKNKILSEQKPPLKLKFSLKTFLWQFIFNNVISETMHIYRVWGPTYVEIQGVENANSRW
jgi:hypothetical protein